MKLFMVFGKNGIQIHYSNGVRHRDFYRLWKRMGVNLVYNHADFRLMSKRALEGLERFEEVNLFLRGIVPLFGFRSTSVYYDRKERAAGKQSIH